jgi:hypothetical protein
MQQHSSSIDQMSGLLTVQQIRFIDALAYAEELEQRINDRVKRIEQSALPQLASENSQLPPDDQARTTAEERAVRSV